jgi:uncharacterized membrane protein
MTDTQQRHALHHPFGSDRFGVLAERFARFFGTPKFIVGQSVLVVLWIALNAAAVGFRWDPYPFILLNLAFSTQAAYAAPLILLAQTRQSDRDKALAEVFEAHREQEALRQAAYEDKQAEGLAQDKALGQQHTLLLAQNTQLTEQVVQLTRELHAAICGEPTARRDAPV